MSTDANEQPGSETTVSATSTHPAIVEPTNPINGPRIHLYTSLSSGSSYVPPPALPLQRCELIAGEYGAITNRDVIEGE